MECDNEISPILVIPAAHVGDELDSAELLVGPPFPVSIRIAEDFRRSESSGSETTDQSWVEACQPLLKDNLSQVDITKIIQSRNYPVTQVMTDFSTEKDDPKGIANCI